MVYCHLNYFAKRIFNVRQIYAYIYCTYIGDVTSSISNGIGSPVADSIGCLVLARYRSKRSE